MRISSPQDLHGAAVLVAVIGVVIALLVDWTRRGFIRAIGLGAFIITTILATLMAMAGEGRIGTVVVQVPDCCSTVAWIGDRMFLVDENHQFRVPRDLLPEAIRSGYLPCGPTYGCEREGERR